ncbi:MAG: universal stress protein [Sandaracinus sp.]
MSTSSIQRILCPVDFSESSDAALTFASVLAKQFGAELHAVHTWELSAYASPTSELAKDTERALKKDLDAAIARAVTNGVVVHAHLRLGPPAETIVAAGKHFGVDHIVMGTAGKGGLERLLVGSVAEQVIRAAEVPVTTVRGRPKA